MTVMPREHAIGPAGGRGPRAVPESSELMSDPQILGRGS